jgi:hypothetical protein
MLLSRKMMGGGRSLDVDAKALISRMTAKPNKTRQKLISDTIKSLKTSGVWAKLDILFMFAAHDEQASLLNWKGNAAWDARFASTTVYLVVDQGINGQVAGFSGGGMLRSDYHETAGQMTQNSACLFSQTLAATGPTAAAGILFSGMRTRISPAEGTFAGTGAIMSAADFSGSVATAPASADDERFFIASRTASGSFVLDRDGTATTITSASAAPATGTLIIGTSGGSTPTPRAIDRLRVVGAGAGLTTANRSSLRNAIWAYLDAIGCPR